MPAIGIESPAFLDSEELRLFEASVGKFLDQHASAEAIETWRANKSVGPQLWKAAGEAGLLGVSVPEAHGGAGGDFRHEIVLIQSIGRRGADGFAISLHNPVILPYLTSFGTESQKTAWLPRHCSGDMVGAIAMTEPGAGSDLQGMRATAQKVEGGYIINGQKTFISNGQLADFILVAAKTDPAAGSKGPSLFIVQSSKTSSGFHRGRNLNKVGQEAQDTSELFLIRYSFQTRIFLAGYLGAVLRSLCRSCLRNGSLLPGRRWP